jgi:hypothetical protein
MSALADPGGRPWFDVGGDVARAIHDATTTAPSAQQWTGGGGTFKVNKDNVLQVAKLVQDAADQLRQKVDERASQMRTAPAMGDPVSEDVANVFNYKLIDAEDSYVNRAYQFVQNWYDTVDQMKKTAHAYGYTEEQIEGALGGPASITLPPSAAGDQVAGGWMASLKGPWSA